MKIIWKASIALFFAAALSVILSGCGGKRDSSNPVSPKVEHPSEEGKAIPAAETALKVRSLIDSGKIEEAETTARKQVAKRPGDAEAHFLLGKALLAKGKRNEARISFEKARDLEPSYASYGKALAEIHDMDAEEAIKSDNPALAVEAWKQCLAMRYKPRQTEKNLAEAFRLLGEKLVAENKQGEAETAFREAAELLPDNPLPRLNLANMMLSEDRLQEAHRELRELSKTHPNFEDGLVAYARVQRRMGDVRGAMDTLKHVLVLNSDNSEAKVLRIELENEVPVKQLEEEHSKTINPDEPDPELLRKLGELESVGDMAGQEVLLTNTLENAPGMMWAKLRLATVEERLDNASASLALIRSYLEERPDDIRGRFVLAHALQQCGALDEAMRTLDALELEGKANLQVYDELGQIQAKKGMFTEAKTSWKKALELDPEYAGAMFNFGQLAMEEGKLKDAETWFNKALAREPFNLKYRYFAGLNLKQAGKTTEAKALWEGGQALLNPQDPYARRIAAALGKKLSAPPTRSVSSIAQAGQASTTTRVVAGDAGIPIISASPDGTMVETRRYNTDAVSAVSVLPRAQPLNSASVPAGISVNITGTLPATTSTIISTSPSAGEDPQYQKGLEAARASKYVEAEAAFTQVLTRNPKNFNAWVNLGNVYAAMDKPADAAARYLRALSVNSGNGFARKALAKVYDELGLNAGEKNLLTGDNAPVSAEGDRQRSNPRSFEPLARAFLRCGLQEQAQVLARIAVEENPDNIELRVLQGEVLGASNRPDAAESSFRKAIDMDKTNPVGYLKLGELLAATGRRDDAFGAYEQVMKSKLADPDTLITLSDRLKEVGHVKEATDMLSRVKGMNLSDSQLKRLQEHNGSL
ncbi:MAG: tetratricopeptide repeat protein [Candidatus Riflebacteria bacterium]|nr:tetratricopeptide repeat protein [Candidatus Riflebacteria bacterium]